MTFVCKIVRNACRIVTSRYLGRGPAVLGGPSTVNNGEDYAVILVGR